MQDNHPEDAASSSNASGKLASLAAAAREELISLSEVWQFQRTDGILEAYEFAEHVYFIVSGSLLSFVQRGDKNIVKWVRSVGDFAFAQKAENTTAVLQKQLTGQIIVALEETNVLRISFENMKRLQDKYPQIDHVITQHILDCTMMDHWLAANESLPPKRKYDYIQEQVGFKLSKVPDLYLASWLGITLGEMKDVRNNI